MRDQNYRMAEKVYESLLLLRQAKQIDMLKQMKTFSNNIEAIQKTIRMYEIAVNHNWQLSAEKVRQKFLRDLEYLLRMSDGANEMIKTNESGVPHLKDIYDEIYELSYTFDGVEINCENNTISVLTKVIELEDIMFGRFRVKLRVSEIPSINSSLPYKVIAQMPNSARTDSSVTHPHVSGETLCEGEGYTILRKALFQGRIGDFFTIVEKILDTYNSDSPYVTLDDWEGRSCYSCGRIMGEDSSYECYSCGDYFCSGCSADCSICDNPLCDSCAKQCVECGASLCEGCVMHCKECGEVFCKNCLDDEVCCKSCASKREDSENEAERSNKISIAF